MPAPQGMTSDVAFVADGHRELALKRCRDARYIEWLRREHRVLTALAATPLRIPRVAGYYEAEAAGQVSDIWLLMTRLPGQSLWQRLLQASASERAELLRELGAALRQLHSTRPPDDLLNQQPWIERRLAQAHQHLAWCDGSFDLLAELERTRPSRQPEVLIHGDLALDNVLVDDAGQIAFIDWSDGDVGDARYDVALALTTEPELHLSEADIAAFVAGYGGARLDAQTLHWFRALYEFF